MGRPSAVTPRADRILARLMEAYEEGDLDQVDASAAELAAANPGIRAWSAYIRAGVQALRGDAEAGLRSLTDAVEHGGWWSPGLLTDPALEAVWPLDVRGVRATAERRWRAAQERAEVSWEVLRPATPPSVVVVSLHGNGPAPADFFASQWAELGTCAAFLVRSRQLAACGVHEWRDHDTAIADVRIVARAARAEFGPAVPLILAGLGAGGRIAVEATLTGAVAAAGAVAFAPNLRPLGSLAPADSRICVFPGGAPASVASCENFAAWARTRGIACFLRYQDGMGHAFPARFRVAMEGVFTAVLE